ncbi:aminotransferase [Stappia sp. ES.058]|uniref:aminotransferase n=1 Tax=Stappia sp. ES.058 TaxID=1881061 RepID=UPI00087B01E0|nr:aminotransferase [Stappia sp. ES.058]SDU16304.1 Aspartate/methionine/tyrosine aminotransferase [Stappia sp. ES.058]
MAHPDLNQHLIDTATPPIPEAARWLSEYDGRHGPAINLSQAVPGDPPPQPFLDRIAASAASAEATRYGDIFGDAPLRQAHANASASLYGADIAPAEVAITAGCNQAFFVSILAVAKAGDAVLLPAPWYFNHKMTLDMLGIEARPLPLSAEAGFVPDATAAAALIDARVKAIVLVTPNNPTGAVYPPETLTTFKALAREKGLWLIVDETYRDFLAGAAPPHDLFKDDDWRDTVISLYSFSKSYAIPGHRLGAVTAAAPVIEEIGKVLDCVQICPARAAQMALPWAIEHLADWRAGVNAALGERLSAFRAALARSPGWRLDQIAAYFAYVRHPFDGVSATHVAERLAREFGLLALPGSYFGPGQDRHLRFAFANVGTMKIARAGERLALYSAKAERGPSNERERRHG